MIKVKLKRKIKLLLNKYFSEPAAGFDESWIIGFKTALFNRPAEYLALCHYDWKGVASSTFELFTEVAYIRELVTSRAINEVANGLIESPIHQFILSGYPQGWSEVIKIVKRQKPQVKFKVLWHGSIAQHYEEYASKIFLEILELSQNGLISCIGLVKKSTFEVYAKLGYNCKFVRNRVAVAIPAKLKALNLAALKVGIFSADVTLRKNTYTNLAAVCYLPDAHVTICPANHHLEGMIKHLKINYTLVGNCLPRAELFKLIQEQDIIFYVTFSECAPMLPLEAMELGIVCLMGANNHYYEDYPRLKEYLVVSEADNPALIATMALRALHNRDLIMEEYHKFSIENHKLSINSITEFLH